MGWKFDLEGEEYLSQGIEQGRSGVMIGNHQRLV